MSSSLQKNPENTKSVWVLFALAVYIVRTIGWAVAEFWYDEVLTLTDFALDLQGRGLWENVFRSYYMANNHILNSAITWGWTRLLNFDLTSEHIVRFPSLFFGGCLIALVICHWRKWLGARCANCGGVLLAVSPVFTAFAYQLRGYSLTMLLSGLALSGAMEFTSGARVKGLLIGCISCLLLPLVIPSNLLLVPLIGLLFFLAKQSSLWKRLLNGGVIGLSGLLGFSYYFTLWAQFLKTTQEPAGWDSGWNVLFHCLFAFGIHVLALLLLRCKKAPSSDGDASQAALPRWPQWILLSSLLLIGATLLTARPHQAPYPRVFLGFLPAITLAALLFCQKKLEKISLNITLVTILLLGILPEKISTEMTDYQLKRGISPSNLLQQYYRGETELRSLVQIFQERHWIDHSMVITDEYDFPTFHFYWMLNGGTPGTVTTLNRSPQNFWTTLETRPRYFWVIAKTPDKALRLMEHAGFGTYEELKEAYSPKEGPQAVFHLEKRGVYTPPQLKPPQSNKNHKLLIINNLQRNQSNDTHHI